MIEEYTVRWVPIKEKLPSLYSNVLGAYPSMYQKICYKVVERISNDPLAHWRCNEGSISAPDYWMNIFPLKIKNIKK
jgi:hypothetical protein